MPTLRLEARHHRADGVQLLRIELPYLFTLEQAATALAVVTAAVPLVTGIHGLVEALKTALEQDVLGRIDRGQLPAPSPLAVRAYREQLSKPGKQTMFPQGALRKQMVRELAEAKQAGPGAVTRVQSTQPRVWSKHTHPDTGEPAVQVEISRFYTVDDAAVALALTHDPGFAEQRQAHGPVPRYVHQLRDQLQHHARQHVGGVADGKQADADLVVEYRRVLLEQKVFRVDRSPAAVARLAAELVAE